MTTVHALLHFVVFGYWFYFTHVNQTDVIKIICRKQWYSQNKSKQNKTQHNRVHILWNVLYLRSLEATRSNVCTYFEAWCRQLTSTASSNIDDFTKSKAIEKLSTNQRPISISLRCLIVMFVKARGRMVQGLNNRITLKFATLLRIGLSNFKAITEY